MYIPYRYNTMNVRPIPEGWQHNFFVGFFTFGAAAAAAAAAKISLWAILAGPNTLTLLLSILEVKIIKSKNQTWCYDRSHFNGITNRTEFK